MVAVLRTIADYTLRTAYIQPRSNSAPSSCAPLNRSAHVHAFTILARTP